MIGIGRRGNDEGRGRAFGALCTFLLLAILVLPATAVAQRVAFVVGNDAYDMAPLDNAVNDARSITATLREIEFEVRHLENIDRGDLDAVGRSLRETMPQGGVGLFYYAGHAVQYQGVNYLLPIDFRPVPAERLSEVAITVDEVLGAMQAAGAGMSILILDACRDNPFGEASGAYGPGLANMQRGTGETLIFYAAAEGAVALDGEGANSPFTAALVTALQRPGLDVYDISRQVRAAVREATGGRQIPYVSGSVETRLVLRPEEEEPAPVFAEPMGEVTLASVHWNSIQRSADPAEYESFMRTYPQSPLAREAALRREQLLDRGAAETPPVRIKVDLPRTPGGLGEIVTECDVVAADPHDPSKVAIGVEVLLLNTRLAVPTCARQVARQPDNPRLLYQLARALTAAGEFEEAAAFHNQAIERDYAAAYFGLGFLYRNGLGVDTDYERAAKLYREAALLGHIGARAATGILYREGWGVPQVPEEGFAWTELAASTGWPPALDSLANLYRLGLGTEVNHQKAFVHYLQAAQLGHSNAMHNLARAYREGKGVDADIDEAMHWFNRATAEGNAYAPYQLGRMHRRGEHVAKDPERALAFLRLAADRGFEWAYWEIARMYDEGDFGRRDPAQAYYYFRVAQRIGELIDNPDSAKLVAETETKLEGLRQELGADELARVEREAVEFVAQNGTVQFTLLKSY